MTSRNLIKPPPQSQPHKANRTGYNKGLLPTISPQNPRHHDRRDHCPNICPRIKNSRRKSPLPFREPLRHRLNRRRKITRLSRPQGRTRHTKTKACLRQRMRHRCHRPDNNRDNIAHFRTNLVDDFSEGQQAYRV